jgi:SpoVK/Ycf46/Vps4 family AAA+-type ATPase
MGAVQRLVDEVDTFIAELTPALEGLARRASMDHERAETDVALDAYALAAALVACDGRITDAEVRALSTAFGGRVEVPLEHATPDEVRRQGLLDHAADALGAPSALFSLLRDADLRDGTALTRAYYDRAMAIAHATVALDGYTDRIELAAVERHRSMLLRLLPGPVTDRGGTGHAASGPRASGPKDAPGRADQAVRTDAAVEPLATVEGLHEPQRSLAELLAELDELIGLDGVKGEVRLVTDLLRVERLRAERGFPITPHSRHLVFTGNPGTGKTTVARLLAQIYRSLGAVARGHLVETDRSGLVAGFVGQTAPRVTEVFDAADGGVLLIDEAYALARGGAQDFGREAIDTLVKLMEDRRDRVVVIVAGYPEEMAELIDSNPGLRSRFPKTIAFDDYTTDELLAILDLLARKQHYTVTPEARQAFRFMLDAAPRDRGFGNGRLVRNLFEAAVAQQASRVIADADAEPGAVLSDAELVTLTAADVPAA